MLLPKKLRCEYLVNPLGLDVQSPRLSWILVPAADDARGLFQIAYRLIVASTREMIVKGEGDMWDSGKVESVETINVCYAGKPLVSRAWCFWKVKVWDNSGNESSWNDCEAAFWHIGLLSKKDWNATWIGVPAKEPHKIKVKDTTKPDLVEIIASDPSPMLRKQFRVSGQVKRAMLYATALGDYEVCINGAKVGDRALAPEWTDYVKRVQYQAYDVTDMIQDGDNAIGAMLADGWYMGLLGPGDMVRQRYYGKNRRLLVKLVVELLDGKVIEVVSDGSWKAYENGPIQSADNFMGETYDARLEQLGWDKPGFDDAKWTAVIADTSINASIVAQKNEPIRSFDTLKPVKITEPSPGMFIFDIGQNMVGWCELRLKGDAGQQVTLRHGEMLDLDGSLYVDNLRLANQTDVFILDGKAERWFHPHFTFHGFRYVEVRGLKGKPSSDMLVGKAFSSDMAVAGSFECSNSMLNQLWKNILWTQRDNTLSIPTDCPQRNERMGWMGDAQVFAQTAIYNMDMAAFFSKFTVDMRDGQGEEGMYPDFAPHPFNSLASAFGPAWGDCGIIVPWRVYVAYGDIRLLAEHYESMKKYVDLIRDENPDFIWRVMGSNYGDWLNGDTLKAKGYPKKGGEMPKIAFATAFYAQSVGMLAKIAHVLGKDDDAKIYGDLAASVRAAFNTTYVKKDGKIEGDTQAGYAVALGFDLLPEDKQAAAVDHLLAAIKQYKGRLSTGFISTIQMMMELSKRGQNEQAYKFAESKQFPSWGYTIENGATTIWERWDGFVAGRGFQDKGMNSFNHYSIGAVGEWLYRVVLGINFDEHEPGMKRVVLAPRPGGSLTWGKGSYDSIRGKIVSSWKKGKGMISHHFELPPNVRATIDLSIHENAKITVNGYEIGRDETLKIVKKTEKQIIIEANPGVYDVQIT
nr:family 78 glycoside hydrolase catalytic domain [Candidatus Sigynarchaeota archaeon]